MSKANWVRAMGEIADELRKRGNFEGLTLTIDELRTHLGMEPESGWLRDRSFWMSMQRGDPEYTGIRDAGLIVSFQPDEKGATVERLTLRLDRFSQDK